jgi:hypothetical protein
VQGAAILDSPSKLSSFRSSIRPVDGDLFVHVLGTVLAGFSGEESSQQVVQIFLARMP